MPLTTLRTLGFSFGASFVLHKWKRERERESAQSFGNECLSGLAYFGTVFTGQKRVDGRDSKSRQQHPPCECVLCCVV